MRLEHISKNSMVWWTSTFSALTDRGRSARGEGAGRLLEKLLRESSGKTKKNFVDARFVTVRTRRDPLGNVDEKQTQLDLKTFPTFMRCLAGWLPVVVNRLTDGQVREIANTDVDLVLG